MTDFNIQEKQPTEKEKKNNSNGQNTNTLTWVYGRMCTWTRIINKNKTDAQTLTNENLLLSQLAFPCSKNTRATCESLLKVNNKDTRKKSVTSFWCLYC